jgi:predicted alpha/beta-fold hydrolase
MTIAPSLLASTPGSAGQEGEAVTVRVSVDTCLLAYCHFHSQSGNRPTILLVHGLEGSSQSVYIVRLAGKAFARGANVVRLNLRNCGDSLHLTPTLYNAGQSEDILAVVDWLVEQKKLSDLFLVGYSLGGNLILKAAAELDGRLPFVSGICAISPSIDLAACVNAMEKGVNRLYDWNFVRRLREKIVRKQRLFPERYDLAKLSGVRTVRSFDDLYTAPDAGYTGAAEYYRCASALPLIKSIAIPTLMIAAQDDPIVPFGLFSSIETDCVRLLAPRYGGHGAFISGDGRSDRFWVDAKVLNFCFDNSKYANA